MPNKIFNIRLRNKRDTEANWEKKNPLILDGEIIVVTTTSGETRVKIGDGIKTYNQLPFLDEVLKNEINNKAAIDAGVYTAVASSSDGVAYTATVPGIESLSSGASFIMIPNKTSASKDPTIDVNGLGAKKIRRRLSAITTSLQSGYSNTWISINKPLSITTPSVNKDSADPQDGDATTSELTLYARARSTTGRSDMLYFKVNGSYKSAIRVYKKVSGTWVEQADLPAIFSGEPSGGASNYVYGGSV